MTRLTDADLAEIKVAIAGNRGTLPWVLDGETIMASDGTYPVQGNEYDGAPDPEFRFCLAAVNNLAALVAEVERLAAGLDAIRRAGPAGGSCLPECSSWLEDYRVNDCDCGYEDAAADAGQFAEDVLAGLAVRAASGSTKSHAGTLTLIKPTATPEGG